MKITDMVSDTALQLGPDSIAACDHVRLLGVTISFDLSLEGHVSTVSASSFYCVHQLRRSRHSLAASSTVTLVHAFMSSCIHYCNAVLVGSPKVTTDRLRVLNVAARVVSGTKKYDRGLSQLLHTELHWLDVPEQVEYELSIMVHNCLNGQAPQYLIDFCRSLSAVTFQQRLRSTSRQLLDVPRYRSSYFARRAFFVAGPSA